jgi:hypothetical protein
MRCSTAIGRSRPRSGALALLALLLIAAPIAADHLGPLGGDADADGIPGTVELHFGLDPNNASDATADLDADGFDNVSEFRQGSEIGNPEDPIVPLQNPHQKVIGLNTGVASNKDDFGTDADIDGNTAVIGSLAQTVYVFVRGAGVWTEQAMLVPSPAPPSWSAFGLQVAISGDTVAVSSYADSEFGFSSGAAYVFTRTAGVWSQQVRLTSPTPSAFDYFGASVALDGDTLVVSASGETTGAPVAGRAYVYTRTGTVWTLESIIDATNTALDDGVGGPLALSGNTLLIRANEKEDELGAAYVFVRSGSTWGDEARLTANDGDAADRFGVGIALDGDTAVIGADLDGDNGNNAGSAYVFTRSGTIWTQAQKLYSSESIPNGFFGRFAALSGDAALFGATYNPPWGAAFLFVRSGGVFSEVSKLTSRDPSFGVGSSVALTDSHLVLGAPFDSVVDDEDGAAYFFELDLDADGASNLDEAAAGTDLLDADSDDDGLLDGFEIFFGFDPMTGGDGSLDPDVDGLTNLGEQAIGTNPTIFDTDGDGVGDGAEVASPGRDPLNPTQNLPALSLLAQGLLSAVVGILGWRMARRSRR